MNVILFFIFFFAAILAAKYLGNMINGFKKIFGAHMLSPLEQYPDSRDGQTVEEIYNYAKKLPHMMQDIYLKKVLPTYEAKQQFKDIVQMNSIDDIHLNNPNIDLQNKSNINNRNIFNIITDIVKRNNEQKNNRIVPI